MESDEEQDTPPLSTNELEYGKIILFLFLLYMKFSHLEIHEIQNNRDF